MAAPLSADEDSKLLNHALRLTLDISCLNPGGGGFDAPGPGDNRPRDADPDRGAGADLVFQCRNETGDCRDGGVVIARRRGNTPRCDDGAGRVDRDRRDFGAAEVDADPEARPRGLSV